MKIEQLFTGCLAEMAYYISDKGEAAIIDPLRETAPYLRMAEADDAKIKYIFLTHFHADFVSGHVDLARKTGATIIFGPNADANFDFYLGKDNEEFPIGNCKLKLLHTPGHTMESSSYLLIDQKGNTPCLFSGDTLFIDDVGRPDLAVKSGSITVDDLAGHLFDSLRNKIMPLPDTTIIYPNHGAGSACGKNMSLATFDTLGNQKKTNYALRSSMTKEEFIKEVTEGLVIPPQHFPNNVRMNKCINEDIDHIIYRGTTPIDAAHFKQLSEQEDVLVIDTRSKESYTEEGSVPDAWYIGVDGNFSPWVGALITNTRQKIIFISIGGREQEVVTRLARVGYDNVLGYLVGGIPNWVMHGFTVDSIEDISAITFAKHLKEKIATFPLDVRKVSEYESEHIIGVTNFPLDFIHQNLHKLNPDKQYYLHCEKGYRSLIAGSILKAKGFNNIININGGIELIRETEVQLSDYVCPTSLL